MTSRPVRPLVPFLVGLGLIIRLPGLFHEVDGQHLFRQAHVAANIYFLDADGLSLQTRHFTENPLMPSVMGDLPRDYRIFDGPIYQNLAALLVRSGASVPLGGRFVNLAAYLLSALLLVALVRQLGGSDRAATWSLLFYVTSPLLMFYERAVIPDPLASAFALLGLVVYLTWVRAPSWWSVMAMAVAVNLAAFIKSPVALPVVLAIIGHSLVSGRWRRPELASAIAMTALAVAGFKVYTNWVNVGSVATPDWETRWYFGALSDRIDATFLRSVWEQVGGQLVTWVGAALAVAALVRRQVPSAVVFWLAGMLASLLIFFPLHARHNYYQIPFVLPVAVAAGYGAACLVASRRTLAAALVLGVLGASYVGRHTHQEPEPLIATGRWIQDHVPVNGFVLYLGDTPGCCSISAYYARRRGASVIPATALKAACAHGGPVYVDVPPELHHVAIGTPVATLGNRTLRVLSASLTCDD